MALERMCRSLLATSAIIVGLGMVMASFVPLSWWHGLPETTVHVDGHPFRVEVARTPHAREHGLMGRSHLADGHGMLFVYAKPAMRRFWMKNTRMPLDILFFDAARRLTHVAHAVPCTADPCAVYTSDKPAAWVLELPAGTAKRAAIKAGDLLSLRQDG